jgi:hypothetical protein
MTKGIWILLLLKASLIMANPKLTFRDTFQRYVSGHDLFRLLNQKFPGADWAKIDQCSGFTEKNRAALGDPNPANGELSYRVPSSSYLRWYLRCLTQGIEKDFEVTAASPSALEVLFGKEVVQLVQGKPYEKMLKDPKSVKWQEVPELVRTAIANQLIDHFVGPGIMKISSGMVGQLLPAIAQSTNVLEAMKKAALYISLQDDFLTY